MSRPRPVNDLALAFALLTAVPVRTEAPGPGQRSHAADYFVVVGIVFGAVAGSVVWLASQSRGLSQLLLASIIVMLWALLSRGMHWDGLADVADAWTVLPERRREVMKDSRTGAFGVLAIVAVFSAQVFAISALLDSSAPVALIGVGLAPVFGRLAATCGAWLGRPLDTSGLGFSVMGRPSGPGVIAALVTASLAAAGTVAAGGVLALVCWAVGIALALVVPHLVSQRFGGVNGDVLGASVIVTETTFLVAVTLVAQGLQPQAMTIPWLG